MDRWYPSYQNLYAFSQLVQQKASHKLDDSNVFPLCQTELLVYECVYLAHGSQHALIISKQRRLVLFVATLATRGAASSFVGADSYVWMPLVPVIMGDQSRLHPCGTRSHLLECDRRTLQGFINNS